MATVSFEQDIKPIFSDYTSCMDNKIVSDDDGTENLRLGDYNIVKRFHYLIQVSIHGHDNDLDEDGNLRWPDAKPLFIEKDPDKGKPVVAAHPMPPRSRLTQKDIDTYDQWIKAGMPA
jgi:hypothetical protein